MGDASDAENRGLTQVELICLDTYGEDGLGDLARHFVDQCGAPTTETNLEQMEHYLAAFALFLARNRTYQDLWKDYGWRDTITHLRSKSMRLVRKFWRGDAPAHDDALLDDVYDLINYAVFFIRNYKRRNEWGI